MTIKDAFNTLIVNAGSTLFTTKVLIDKLLNRPHKSAVITVSSGT
jgi:short-subunit dehydrogenase involved in D-alanine esterification of teichoic acids